jgi:hypothetical protein
VLFLLVVLVFLSNVSVIFSLLYFLVLFEILHPDADAFQYVPSVTPMSMVNDPPFAVTDIFDAVIVGVVAYE